MGADTALLELAERQRLLLRALLFDLIWLAALVGTFVVRYVVDGPYHVRIAMQLRMIFGVSYVAIKVFQVVAGWRLCVAVGFSRLAAMPVR